MGVLVLTKTQMALLTVCTTLISLLVQYSVTRLKTKLDRHLYITKLKYDTEFEVYKKLSCICSEIIKTSENLYDKANQDKYENLKEKNNILHKTLVENEAFINDKIYANFIDFKELVRKILIYSNNGMLEECEDCKNEIRKGNQFKEYRKKNNNLLEEYHNIVINPLKEYLAKLKIIEG